MSASQENARSFRALSLELVVGKASSHAIAATHQFDVLIRN